MTEKKRNTTGRDPRDRGFGDESEPDERGRAADTPQTPDEDSDESDEFVTDAEIEAREEFSDDDDESSR